MSWKSKKQSTISLSSAKAEYWALRLLVAEVVWILRPISDLGVTNLMHAYVFVTNN